MSATDDTRRSLTAVRTAISALTSHYSFNQGDRADALFSDGPDPAQVIGILRSMLSVLLPGRMVKTIDSQTALEELFERTLLDVWKNLQIEIVKALPAAGIAPERLQQQAFAIVERVFAALPAIRAATVEDIQAAYDGDPAAMTYAEIKLAYPGLLAITAHRVAHQLYLNKVPIIPRIMSEWVHGKTGVDIHPGAQIGLRFFIDHATGVVIGETAKIGNNVKFYHGVTLGARSFALDESGNPVKQVQRHPTVEDNVVIYAHATILGGDTVIGAGSTIGGNVFLVDSVPPGSIVVRDGSGSKIVNKLK